MFSLCTVAKISTVPTLRSSIRRDGKLSAPAGGFCPFTEARECVSAVSQTPLIQIRPLAPTVDILILKNIRGRRAASVDRSSIHNGSAHAKLLGDQKPRLEAMDRKPHADLLLNEWNRDSFDASWGWKQVSSPVA